jgi:hypothetical protein
MILQLNILHFSVRESSFVKKDITYLKESHAVKILTFNTKNKFFTPFAFIFQKIQLLVHIWFADVLVCQFSGYHSFLPALFGKIFKKPVLIISGGTDCNSFPSIRYGNLYRPILKIFTHWSFKLASHIAPKHNSLMIRIKILPSKACCTFIRIYKLHIRLFRMVIMQISLNY